MRDLGETLDDYRCGMPDDECSICGKPESDDVHDYNDNDLMPIHAFRPAQPAREESPKAAPEGREQWDAKEAAKQVYWRTCSQCGDVDRDSLAKALEAAYSLGQIFCTAHTQVYERVQVLEVMLRAAEESASLSEARIREVTAERELWRNEQIRTENVAKTFQAKAASAVEREKRLREALRAGADEAEQWIENGINGGAVEWRTGLEVLVSKLRHWAALTEVSGDARQNVK